MLMLLMLLLLLFLLLLLLPWAKVLLLRLLPLFSAHFALGDCVVAEEAGCHFPLLQRQRNLPPHARKAVAVRRGAVERKGFRNWHVVQAHHALDLAERCDAPRNTVWKEMQVVR